MIIKLGTRDSDAHCRNQNPEGCQLPQSPLEPPTGTEPVTFRLQGGRSAS